MGNNYPQKISDSLNKINETNEEPVRGDTILDIFLGLGSHLSLSKNCSDSESILHIWGVCRVQ